MTRSKFSTKAIVLAGAIGLSVAAFARQPAAAQEYCSDGLVPDPTYGCNYDYPNYGYTYLTPYYGGYGWHRGDHGFGHGMGDGFDHGAGFAHAGGFHGGFGGGFHGGGFGGGGHR
jgi:hypothetical protein